MKQPAVESRGGEHPDWARTRPGEELPQLPDPELHDPPVQDRQNLAPDQCGGGCGNPLCESG
jgi:hypothetical protein